MLKDEISYLKDTMAMHRRELNSIAELGMQEFLTSKYIKNYLLKLGVEFEVMLETAVVGKIKGKAGQKCIGFRSDMDGLSIGNKVKHLCGHDGHMSILLGLIEYVKMNEDRLEDDFVFVFQPAEESPGGARPLIKMGLIEKYNINEIYGLHVYPELEQGNIGIRPKHFLAQTGEVDIEIIGLGGHGAMPQNTVDSVVIAANFINSIQTIVSRNISPIDEAVVSIGKIEGGSRRNIIAQNVKLEGTIRAFKEDVYDKLKERIYNIAKGMEQSFCCEIRVNIKDDYPAVCNDESMFNEFVNVFKDGRIKILDPLMISEDFSYYQKEIPGLFFMLGSRSEEKGHINGLHHEDFNFDEATLDFGLKTYIELLAAKKSII